MAGVAIGGASIGAASNSILVLPEIACSRLFFAAATFDKSVGEAAYFSKSAESPARFDKRADIAVSTIS